LSIQHLSADLYFLGTQPDRRQEQGCDQLEQAAIDSNEHMKHSLLAKLSKIKSKIGEITNQMLCESDC